MELQRLNLAYKIKFNINFLNLILYIKFSLLFNSKRWPED